jgi:PAS domain S-box-containing protein
LKGRSIFEIIHPDDLPDAKLAFRDLLARPGASMTQVLRNRHGNGEWVWIECVATNLLQDPTVGAIVCNARDITARKRAEEDLRTSEARYRALVDATAQVIWTADERGHVHGLTEWWAGLTGQPRRETADVWAWLEQVHPDDQALVRASWTRSMEALLPYDVEFRVRSRDGSFRHIAARAVPILTPDGRLREWVGAVDDISERRSLEEQLRQAQKMEAIGRLAGGIAHDFNNLLTVILGYTEAVSIRLGPENPLQRKVCEISKAGERAARLTSQLLAFSRKQILQPRNVDINEVISSSDGMLRRLIGEDLDLLLSLDPAAGKVYADPGQLEQVLLNLAVNSRDAMPDGGFLSIETGRVEIAGNGMAGLPPGDYVLLEVSDSGCGMDEFTRQHLFEPFFTTKEPGRGTGLGLSTVYGIVQQSGGVILVDTAPGEGARFSIYLPRVESKASEEQERVTAFVCAPQRRGTILLVEDELAVRELAEEALAEAGYTVMSASLGLEAVRRAEECGSSIDLLITDVVMPGMSGPEVARHLIASSPSARVLYLSGYTDHPLLRGGALGDEAHFLQKPFTMDTLLGKVQDILSAVER